MNRYIIPILILIVATITPALAVDSPNIGTALDTLFYQQDNLDDLSVTGSYTTNISQIYFPHIDGMTQFNAIKYYDMKYSSDGLHIHNAPIDSFGHQINFSYKTVGFYDNLTNLHIGDGVMQYTLDLNNHMDISVFSDSWDIGGLIDDAYINITNSDINPWNIVAANGGDRVYFASDPGCQSDENITAYLHRINGAVGSCIAGPHRVIEYSSNIRVDYIRTPKYPQDQFDFSRDNYGMDNPTTSAIATSYLLNGSWVEAVNDTSGNDLNYVWLPNGSAQKVLITNPFTGRIFTYTWGGVFPGTCNFTAAIQNYNTGNIIAGSYLNMWDLTTGKMEQFYLQWGVGNVSVPALGHIYAWNASKPGYTGTDMQPVGGTDISTCEVYQASPIYAHLVGPPTSDTNGTLWVNVHDNSLPYNLPVAGARVVLNTGPSTSTNLAGSAQFNLLILNQTYNYTVSKTGYLSVDGDITMEATNEIVDITMIAGAIPTATITGTMTPTVPHDTTNEAIDLVKENAYNLMVLFLLATILGVIKLMGK